LLKKYTASGNYKNYNTSDALEKCVNYGEVSNLKTEMKQAMKDIEKINKEIDKQVK
jgi:hypothetical protein